MNYKKINFEIVTRKGGATIKGQEGEYVNKYLKFDCINPINMDERPHRVTCFAEAVIKYYETLLPESRGGKLPNSEDWSEDKMPVKDRIFTNGEAVEYDFGGQYVQKYSQDIMDGDKLIHAAGDYVCIKGTKSPKITSRKVVFCQYYYETEAVLNEWGQPEIDPNTFATKVRMVRDKDGLPIKHWVEGWDPETVGSNLKNAFYIPIAEYVKEMGTSASKDTSADVESNIPKTKDADEDDDA